MDKKEYKLIIEDCYGKKFIYEKSKIDFSDKGKIPERLYKYYAITENTINSIADPCNPYIYFSHPHQFNDLVDSSVLLWNFDKIDIDTFEILFKLTPNDYQNDFKNKYSKDKSSDYKDFKSIFQDFIYENLSERLWIYYISRFNNFIDLKNTLFFLQSSEWGVLCLTEKLDNNLMWAHYTSEYGFCIEFDSGLLLNSFEKHNNWVFPINYQKEMNTLKIENKKTISLNPNHNKYSINFNVPFFYLFSVKDESWSYENEWRILLHNKGMGYEKNKLDFNYTGNINHQKRSICYSKKAIKRIILGAYFFNNNSFEKEEITAPKYNFKGEYSGLYKQLLYSFLNNYNDCLFQIEHFVDKDVIIRKITHKISIESMDNKSVVIKADLLPDFV